MLVVSVGGGMIMMKQSGRRGGPVTWGDILVLMMVDVVRDELVTTVAGTPRRA